MRLTLIAVAQSATFQRNLATHIAAIGATIQVADSMVVTALETPAHSAHLLLPPRGRRLTPPFIVLCPGGPARRFQSIPPRGRCLTPPFIALGPGGPARVAKIFDNSSTGSSLMDRTFQTRNGRFLNGPSATLTGPVQLYLFPCPLTSTSQAPSSMFVALMLGGTMT